MRSAKTFSRRNFFRTLSVAAPFIYSRLTGRAGQSAQKALRLGGPVFLKSDDPADLAREHRRLGYSAAYCPRATATDTDRVRAIEKAFAAQNVVIAEVGAWRNMLDSDTEKRRANLNYVVERLALADEVGARNCVNIAGSYNPRQWDGPDPRNLSREYTEATVENCRKVIDAVNPKRTKFTIEMMGWSLPNSADSYLRLHKAVNRAAFGVHVDICNIIQSPQDFYRNTELIEEVFRKLGRWVCSCHAKDLEGRAVHFAETVPGRGGVDYRAYLRRVTALPQSPPLMLEHLSTPEEYEEGKLYIIEVAAELRIPLA